MKRDGDNCPCICYATVNIQFTATENRDPELEVERYFVLLVQQDACHFEKSIFTEKLSQPRLHINILLHHDNLR